MNIARAIAFGWAFWHIQRDIDRAFVDLMVYGVARVEVWGGVVTAHSQEETPMSWSATYYPVEMPLTPWAAMQQLADVEWEMIFDAALHIGELCTWCGGVGDYADDCGCCGVVCEKCDGKGWV